MIKKFINYIKSAAEEMKKVTWPTQKETQNYTVLVISVSLGVALFLGAVDYLFSQGLELIIKK